MLWVEWYYNCREEASNSQYPDYYYQMWPRLPQYLTGILLGWIITSQLNTNDEYESVTLNWVILLLIVCVINISDQSNNLM